MSAFEDDLTQALIPFIDSKFRTIGASSFYPGDIVGSRRSARDLLSRLGERYHRNHHDVAIISFAVYKSFTGWATPKRATCGTISFVRSSSPAFQSDEFNIRKHHPDERDPLFKGGTMKQILCIALLLSIAPVGYSKSKDGSFTGEIMDKMCAQMNSHDNMMKSEGASDARDCTLKCVKGGGSFALYDYANKKVYALENTKQVRQYAGQRVQVTGTYDSDADMLHIKSISPAK